MRWRSRGGMAEEGELLHYTLLAGWLDWHVSRRGRRDGVGGMTETAPALSTSRTSAVSKQEFPHRFFSVRPSAGFRCEHANGPAGPAWPVAVVLRAS